MGLSAEQSKIVESLKNNNVIVNAVAGSGKTTTAFGVIENNPGKNVLMLTYNKALQSETQNKVREKGYKKVKVATYHAFAGYLYGRLCKDDNLMRKILFDNDDPKTRKINYDILIIDEAQDLTLLYLCLIRKLLLVNSNKDIKVLVMGDYRQSIYQFMDADARYLLNFDSFMGDIVKGPWVRLPLKQSYRVGKNTVDFVNDAFYQKDIMKSNGKNDKFEYLVVNTWNMDNKEGTWFAYLLSEIKKYDVNDIFILSSSNDNPVTTSLANSLNEEGFTVENSGDIFADKKSKKNKINFSTFHSSKGLEKRLVIIVGFDSSLDYFAENKEEALDPLRHNPEYVALTRGTEKVIVLASYDKHSLYFLNQDWIKRHANTKFLEPNQNLTYELKQSSDNLDIHINLDFQYPVTSLCDFLKEKYILEANECFSIKKTEKIESKEVIESLKSIPSTVKEFDSSGRPYEEDVANFNGISIVQDFADHRNNENPYISKLLEIMDMINQIANHKQLAEIDNPELYNFVKSTFFTHGKNIRKRKNADWLLKHRAWVGNLKIKELKEDISSLLKLVVLNETSLTNRTFIAKQISNYDWVPNNSFKKSTEFLNEYFKKDVLTFEDSFTYNFEYSKDEDSETIPVQIQGFTDCIDWTSNSIYEFKFMGGLGDEERVQLVSYAMLIYSLSLENAKFPIKTETVENTKWYLWNLKTGIKEELEIDFSKRDVFFKALINNKIEKYNDMSLEQLVDRAKKRFGKIE